MWRLWCYLFLSQVLFEVLTPNCCCMFRQRKRRAKAWHGRSLPALFWSESSCPRPHTHTLSTSCITVWSVSFLEEQSGCSLLTERAGCPFPVLTITAELFTFQNRLSPSDLAAAITRYAVVLFIFSAWYPPPPPPSCNFIVHLCFISLNWVSFT